MLATRFSRTFTVVSLCVPCPGTTDVVVPDENQNVGCDEICNNGQDDDGDGLVDCADDDCQDFVRAYNDIVVHDYAKVRLAQKVSCLGPLAGLALVIKGISEQWTATPGNRSSKVVLGISILIISTLTALATARLLRAMLLRQVHALIRDFRMQQNATTTATVPSGRLDRPSRQDHDTIELGTMDPLLHAAS